LLHRLTRFITTLFSIGLVFCFSFSISLSASGQSADEMALRSLAEKFFAVYQKADLDSLMLLWSEKSPDYVASKKNFQQSFAANKIELKSLTLGKVTMGGEKASLRVLVDLNAVEVKTGKPAAGFGKLNQTLHFSKEGSVWKVARFVSSEEELAAALVEAKTEAERKALLEADKGLTTVALVQALLAQGHRLSGQNRNQQALVIYGLAEEIANYLDDKKSSVVVQRYIGIIHLGQRNHTQALEYFHKSLKLAEKIGAKADIGHALHYTGNAKFALSNYQEALEYHQRSLKIREEIGDKAAIGNTLANIGGIHRSQGNSTQALKYYQKSLKIREEIGDKAGISITLYNFGNTYQLQGNSTQALEYHQKSLKIKENIGDKTGIGNTLTNIGGIHRSQGNHAQALEYFQKSLKIKEGIGEKAGIGNALNDLGVVHQSQGNSTQAHEYLQRSLKIREEIGDKAGIGLTLNNIGSIHRSQGNSTHALECHQKSLKIAEEIGSKIMTCNALTDLGVTHQSLGNHHQAVEFAIRAADLAQQIGSPNLFWDSRILAGQAYQALNQPDEAKKAFTDAISAIEETRNQIVGNEQQQQQFFAGKLAPYYGMLSLLIGQNNSTEAFAFAERAKARALLDVLQTGKLNITKAMSLAEKQQEQKFNSELVSLNAQIYTEKLRTQQDQARLNELNARLQKARLDMEAFQASLYAAHPELKVQRGQAQALSLTDAAALIPDNKTALLEFVVSEDQTFLFVLTKNKSASPSSSADLKLYKIDIKQKELAKLCREFRQRLADRRVHYQDIATQLYDLLLKPVRASLAGKTNLVIIPDGVLWELPFQALQPARNHFLIEDSAISYAPSLTVLHKMVTSRPTRSTKASTTLLAVGNPIVSGETSTRVKSVLMDEQLLPLPEAERQVKLLGQLYTASQSKVYVGQAASEAIVKAEAGGSRILHLATHGILNDASPMYSQIVLARSPGDSNEDGLLEAWEIMNLELKADLVVLSACETGRGKLGAGEGMIGLSWALFVAGSPATVVSQWKVESASTTELMVEFHRNLRVENRGQRLTKAEALRRAALKLLKMKDYRHPFYWAAFVIIGDAN
jgi:CHAT domain-containing protein/Tfp pilus assembly protein PilF